MRIAWGVATSRLVLALALASSSLSCGLLAGIETFQGAPPDASSLASVRDGGVDDEDAFPSAVSPAPPSDAAGGDSAVTSPLVGTITLSSYLASVAGGAEGASASGRVTAQFGLSEYAPPGCTRRVDGACVVVKCAAGLSDPATVGARSAGVVQITGTTPSSTLSPAANATYAPSVPTLSQGAPYFDENSKIKVTAAGAQVGTFSLNVQAGRDLGVDATSQGLGDGPYVWNGTAPTESIGVEFAATDGSVSALCIVTGKNNFTAPASVMADMPASGNVALGTLTTASLTVGTARVTVRVHLARVGTYLRK